MPWSHKKLNWFGHMTRLPYNTPAKLALHHALKPTIRPRGQQKNDVDFDDEKKIP